MVASRSVAVGPRGRVAAVVAAAVALVWYLQKLWEYSRIPCVAPSMWEMLKLLVVHRGDLGKVVVSLNKAHGFVPLKFMFLGIVRLVIVSSPGMWELEKMPKGKWYYMLNVLFGDNLITLNHARHKKHRQLMSNFNSLSALHATLPALNHYSDRLVQQWRKHRTVEIEDWMTRVTFDIISNQVFGLDTDCMGSNPEGMRFSSNCRQVAGFIMKHYLHAPGLAHIWKRAHHRLYADVDNKIYECIARRRAERAERERTQTDPSAPEAPRARDLLDLMLDATVKGKWSDEELRDECFILFLAGHETTAETLTWILIHIAADQKLQARLREEVRGVGGTPRVRKETLDQFPELVKVCKEALRMYPPAFMVTRYGEREVNIDGCPVPKGYDFMLNLIGMQRDPTAYKSPDHFDPSRWDEESCGNGGYFAPFAIGPRQCLGMHFFWLEARVVLSTILANFELSCDHVPDWNTIKISTQPTEPVSITLTPIAAEG